MAKGVSCRKYFSFIFSPSLKTTIRNTISKIWRETRLSFGENNYFLDYFSKQMAKGVSSRKYFLFIFSPSLKTTIRNTISKIWRETRLSFGENNYFLDYFSIQMAKGVSSRKYFLFIFSPSLKITIRNTISKIWRETRLSFVENNYFLDYFSKQMAKGVSSRKYFWLIFSPSLKTTIRNTISKIWRETRLSFVEN